MGSKRRSSDIISLLVSIYGSKDIFIDEYRAVLADRLLHQLNYNTARYNFDYILYTQNRQKYKKSSIKVFSSAEKLKRENVLKKCCLWSDVCPFWCVCREIRNVELLKLRFGESHMHYCEVMLKVNAV